MDLVSRVRWQCQVCGGATAAAPSPLCCLGAAWAALGSFVRFCCNQLGSVLTWRPARVRAWPWGAAPCCYLPQALHLWAMHAAAAAAIAPAGPPQPGASGHPAACHTAACGVRAWFGRARAGRRTAPCLNGAGAKVAQTMEACCLVARRRAAHCARPISAICSMRRVGPSRPDTLVRATAAGRQGREGRKHKGRLWCGCGAQAGVGGRPHPDSQVAG